MKYKLARKRDVRRALIRGLVTTLVAEEKLVTTVPKAKAMVPYFERMVTLAKKNTLAGRRQIAAFVTTEAATTKLMDDLAKRFASKNGGYARLGARSWRQGDDAAVVTIELTVKAAAPAKVETPAKAKQAAPKVKAAAGSKA